MKNVFINTDNVNRVTDVCAELESPEGMIGPSLAMLTGPAGRGKSEFAKHYATNSTAIYVPPMNIRTPTMLLREIAFELCAARPGRSEMCLNIISDEMERERRLIIIDEADLLPVRILEMLRNLNERTLCPILLIGEEGLKGKIMSRRRLASRIRRQVMFGKVQQGDVILFFRKALLVAISSQAAGMILKKADGDWRPILTAAIGIERAMRASGLQEPHDTMIAEILGGMS
jgi:DNA transposition AAA+ family ATPase